jgi:hypothetical protein
VVVIRTAETSLAPGAIYALEFKLPTCTLSRSIHNLRLRLPQTTRPAMT